MTESEAHAVEWTSPARRALARLPEHAATAAVELVYGPLAAAPRRVGRPLRFELEGLWSARRGAYRVIYELDARAHVVRIIAIDHRSDVYRRR